MGRVADALAAFFDTLAVPEHKPRYTVRPAETDRELPRTPLVPLEDVPAAAEPVEYLGAETFPEISGYVFLLWNTAAGILAAAHPTCDDRPRGKPPWIRDLRPDVRVLISQHESFFQVPDGPELRDHAVNEPVLWRHYAAAIGRPAPHWPRQTNYRSLIEQWQPGDPIVATPAKVSPERDPAPLVQLAALYEPDSTVAGVLRHFYRYAITSFSGSSRMVNEAWQEERDGTLNWHLTGYLHQASTAIPAPAPGNLEDQFTDTAIRAAIAEIYDRKDTLTVEAVQVLNDFTSRYLPFSETKLYHPGSVAGSAEFAEWWSRLEWQHPHQPDPRFANLHQPQGSARYLDPETGAPVILEPDGQVFTLLPRRLPTMSPLAEVILDGADPDGQGDLVWVRTSDGTLYPLPAEDEGYAWGYGGTGPGNIGVTVHRLLDDITAPTRMLGAKYPSPVEKLFKKAHPGGARFTRAELEEARDSGK